MPNNRIIYATTMLSFKDTKADPTTVIMGVVDDATLSSGISAAVVGTINFNEAVSGVWPSPGQFKIRSAGDTEFIRYSGFVSPSGAVVTERGTAGTTAAAHADASRVRLTGWEVPFKVQSASIGTSFNLEDVFELGQLEPCEVVEGIPDIEITSERVLDGTKPFYLIATGPDGDSLKEKTENFRTDIAFSIYPDSQDSATGTPDSTVTGSGMFLSSISYTFPADGSNFTESITLVGNDKSWGEEEGVPSGLFTSGDAFLADVVGSGVQRSEDFDPAASTLPTSVPSFDHIQSIEVSADIGREEIFELGQKSPFFRPVTFPVEVTSTFETITDKGDLIDAIGNGRNNLVNETIVIKTQGGLKVDLGTRNKVSSTTMEGADAGGGNLTVTIEYRNTNRLTISHDSFLDPFDTNADLPGFSL